VLEVAEEVVDEMIQLGGSIELSGFKDIDRGSMVILKKIVGNYVKKFNEKVENFQKLSLHVKKVHSNEEHALYEFQANLMANGKIYPAEVSDRNVFAAVDNIIKKL
jgi:hypothetical protein